MPDHWGLGLLHNAGDDLDGDYQSTVDRIAFFTGLESLSLYAGGAWDFPYEGPTSAAFTAPGGQPYDLAQFDDVSAMNLLLFRKVNPQARAAHPVERRCRRERRPLSDVRLPAYRQRLQ